METKLEIRDVLEMKELYDLYKENILGRQDVIDYATPGNNKLHNCFNWDNKDKDVEIKRLNQARNIIADLKIYFEKIDFYSKDFVICDFCHGLVRGIEKNNSKCSFKFIQRPNYFVPFYDEEFAAIDKMEIKKEEKDKKKTNKEHELDNTYCPGLFRRILWKHAKNK